MTKGLHDLSERMPEMTAVPGPKQDVKHYPSLHVSDEQLPDLAEYEVGDEVELVVRGVLVSKDISEGGHDGKQVKRTRLTVELREGRCVHEGAHKVAKETGLSLANAKKASGRY